MNETELHDSRSPSLPEPRPANEAFLPCGWCAIWVQSKEDSIPGEWGICPRRNYPECRTHITDGCALAVWPVE
jgi:hypothetical protein